MTPMWLASLKIFTHKTATAKPDEDDLDPALTSTQEYAKITGKRAAKTEKFVAQLDGELGMRQG